MDQVARTFPPLARIDLAQEADFAIGPLKVRPSLCEVEMEGARRPVQRRVMQVLVALTHPDGEVVSHDELLRRCWGGLSVSEDATGRCIAQLRRLAEAWPRPPFEIETIPGVGYRLTAAPSVEAPGAPARLRRPGRIGAWIAAGVALALVVAGATWAALAWRGHSAGPVAPLVEVRPFRMIGADPALAPLAAQASDAIAGFLGGAGVRLASGAKAPAPAPAQLAFDGVLSSADGQLYLHLVLADTLTGIAVWAHDFTETTARPDALTDAAKGGALETMHLVREAEGRSGAPLDAETLQLAIRGGEILNAPSMADQEKEDGVRPYEEALRRRPDSGALRARYAYALSQLALASPPAERAQPFQRARAEAERVIREHPSDAGMARLALLTIAQAQAPNDWVAAEKGLDAALKASPEEPFLYGAKCDFLVGAGRAADAKRFCDRALSLRPMTGQFLLTMSEAMDAEGEYPQVADQDLALGARLYPDFNMLRVYRYARQAFTGSPDKALALLRDPDTTPPPLAAFAVAEMEALEQARKSGAPADAANALAIEARNNAHIAQIDSRFLFPMALGRLDEAFAAKDLSLIEGDERVLLTFAFTAPLRRDPRFWPLAARAGLTRYWLTTNKWPDFCRDPTYPLDCRAQARRAEAEVLAGKPGA
jgi:DNA-binding winged helix-turn-helix (wHTH) protein